MLLIDLPQRLLMVSLCGKKNVLSLISFFPLDQIPKINICHMVASKHHQVIEGGLWLITTDVPDSKEAVDDVSIDNYGRALDGEDQSDLGEEVVRTGITQ